MTTPTLARIGELETEKQSIWRAVSGRSAETVLAGARERIHAIDKELEPLWDSRRRELAGGDYDDGGLMNSPARGRLGGRQGQWTHWSALV